MAKTIIKKILDISSFQGELSDVAVAKIKAAGVGVILRLGYTGYESNKPALDNVFDVNFTKLKAAGVPVGVYYFTIAYNNAMANNEAQFILSHLEGKTLELPVCIDVESQARSDGWTALNGQARASLVKYICTQLQNHGYYVSIYASKSWLTDSRLLDASQLTAFDKWVAQYNITCTYSGNYGLWQYSSKESASKYGITKTSYVDISNAYYDYEAIIKSKGLNNYGSANIVTCPYCSAKFEVK